VRERQNLLREARGLVEPQSFAFADYKGRKPGRWLFQLGLAIYDRLAGTRARHYFPAGDFLMLAPHINTTDLQGGMCYVDAKTDDARLVLRVLQEARGLGALPSITWQLKNFCVKVTSLTGTVTGVMLHDAVAVQDVTVRAKIVINATGAWADALRQQQGEKPPGCGPCAAAIWSFQPGDCR
jgi:glycerol-3-phosphate dehydrogenase